MLEAAGAEPHIIIKASRVALPCDLEVKHFTCDDVPIQWRRHSHKEFLGTADPIMENVRLKCSANKLFSDSASELFQLSITAAGARIIGEI